MDIAPEALSAVDEAIWRIREQERERAARIVESHLGATTETKHLVAPLVASIRRAHQ